MLLSPVGLRREKGCAGVAQEELKTTDLTTWQREHPQINKPETLKIIKEKRRKIGLWSQMSA
jgi:hypothetical protein